MQEKSFNHITKDTRVCILSSGGLDSLISYHYAKQFTDNVICLWVNHAHPYANKEREALNKYGHPVTLIDLPMLKMKDYMYDYPTYDKQVVPGRNMWLATIAANFGDVIWVNALKGELVKTMPDKNHTFFTMASAVLSYTFEHDKVVESPFEFMTKVDIVRWALDHGIDAETLKATSSCYDDNIRNCGKCGTCFKRHIAMITNGIEEEYAEDPFTSKYASNLLHRFTTGYDPDYRVRETLNAYKITNQLDFVVNTIGKEELDKLVEKYGV